MSRADSKKILGASIEIDDGTVGFDDQYSCGQPAENIGRQRRRSGTSGAGYGRRTGSCAGRGAGSRAGAGSAVEV
jgi:hypothetical protein